MRERTRRFRVNPGFERAKERRRRRVDERFREDNRKTIFLYVPSSLSPPPSPPSPLAPPNRDAARIDLSVLYPLAGMFAVVASTYGIIHLSASKKLKVR